MITEKQLALLRTIRDKTLEGKIKWVEGPKANSFSTSFPDSTVMISFEPREDTKDYVFSVLNANADLVIQFNDIQLEDYLPGRAYLYLEELFVTARENAYNVDAIIDEIIKKLSDE